MRNKGCPKSFSPYVAGKTLALPVRLPHWEFTGFQFPAIRIEPVIHPEVTLRAREVEFFVLPTVTRFPFQYGIASMTSAPHLFVQIRLTVNGREGIGTASEGLPPKWFTKDPTTTFEEDLPEMIAAIRNAAGIITTKRKEEPFFGIWFDLYHEQERWARERGMPMLLGSLGVSLMERALLDGTCRVLGRSFLALLHRGGLALDLGAVDPGLAGVSPSDHLPRRPDDSINIRHTVGIADYLRDREIPESERVEDGLPQSLEASLEAYGLSYFKVKLSGALERDRARLGELQSILSAKLCGDYYLTLDGNEQFDAVDTFREHWEGYMLDDRVRNLLERILFVEQPLHRSIALDQKVGVELLKWRGHPPLTIDESDGALGDLGRALELGYVGTSHKNCKGIVKGIANACLLQSGPRNGREGACILSGEDLCTVGPFAVLPDLLMMASLGISHVERNGHHYYRGLSVFPEDLQERLLRHHSDLYTRRRDGLIALAIENGRARIGSLLAAPFGVKPSLNVARFTPIDEWISGAPSP